MSDNPLYSLEVEKHALGGLYNHPAVFPEIDSFIKDSDFYNDVHSVIYCVVRAALTKQEKPDKVIFAQRIKDLGIAFKDGIDIFDYLDSITFTQVTKEATVQAFQELVKFRIRRELCKTAEEIRSFVVKNPEIPIDELVAKTDSIYSSKVLDYNRTEEFTDIFNSAESQINAIADNPPDPSKFLLGPFPTINHCYGSLHRPGNITVCGARSGVGKTSLAMYYNTWLAEKHNLPILWLDFGEMSGEELQFRAVSMFTKGEVPYWAIEDGSWKQHEIWSKMVPEALARMKKIRNYYVDIAGKTPLEIISLIRRFAYNKAGRGNFFLVSYDYLKPFDTTDFNTPEWKQMGHFIQDIKSFIKGELQIPFWASLQLNRSGITTNKKAADIDDSENTFGISDRIQQQSSHAFIFRSKVLEEIQEENNEFGNTKVIFVKFRHMGKGASDALIPVKVGNKKFLRNYINLESRSFYFEDRGDLREMVKKTKMQFDIKTKTPDDSEVLA